MHESCVAIPDVRTRGTGASCGNSHCERCRTCAYARRRHGASVLAATGENPAAGPELARMGRTDVARRVLLAAIAVGGLADGSIAVIALFFQNLLGPLFDLPLRDPALTTVTGGAYVVLAAMYAVLLRDLDRYRVLLYLVALDQTFGAVLPAIEILRHHVVASPKTLGPIPLNLVLAAVYLAGTRTRRAPAPSFVPRFTR